jgi:hypothetical protein
LVHLLIIEPILGSAPINQLLATGGLLFFLQSFATLMFGTVACRVSAKKKEAPFFYCSEPGTEAAASAAEIFRHPRRGAEKRPDVGGMLPCRTRHAKLPELLRKERRAKIQ